MASGIPQGKLLVADGLSAAKFRGHGMGVGTETISTKKGLREGVGTARKPFSRDNHGLSLHYTLQPPSETS